MKKLLLSTVLVLSTSAFAEESLITPADLSDADLNKMYEHHMNYNRCMMQARLSTSSSGQQVQMEANKILESCEPHLEELKTHLLDKNVNEGLAIGMTKKMRSRGARDLMTKGMNQMAQQASAVINAEEIKAQEQQAEQK